MSQFFIRRPNLAWVTAIFILLAGLLAIPALPVAQFPDVAPPQIAIAATYPGASATTVMESVTSVIEEELSGTKGLLYFDSSSSSTGMAEITATFAPGTDPALAQVEVQNRIKKAEPRLPASVLQQGLQVEQASANFLLIYSLTYRGDDSGKNEVRLSDFAVRNINNEIRRVPGVGKVQFFGADAAMRVWVDPQKLLGYGLSVADVNAAIAAQNAQVPAGSFGGQPGTPQQELTATIAVRGTLASPQEFGQIVLRAQANGAVVRLADVARLELGQLDYSFSSREDGRKGVAAAVQLAPGANALKTAEAVKARLAELAQNFPDDIQYIVPYDTSRFVGVAIGKVLQTLAEAVVLVFLVMWLFLQNLRYTLIPTIVVPVCLAGTLAVMYALGFSVNMMTMFGMVLAIGILVDDAIVVVENVERIMVEEGLSPLAATRKAMGQISGAIVGITVVLVSVFIPMAFFSGSVGNIYRQFSLSMVASMLFSAFLALSLTPALCATLLKPVPHDHHEKSGFFGWFNRFFKSTTHGYEGWAAKLVHRGGRVLLIYVAIVAVVGWLYVRMPSSFLPSEDQGNMIVNIQLPPGATSNRTEQVIKQVEDWFLKQPQVKSVVGVIGFSFSGTGQNAALAFVTLKDWHERPGAENSAQSLVGRAFAGLGGIRDAFIFPLNPPAIRELGNATGFAVRVQDRAGLGPEALLAARNQVLGMAMKNPVLTGVRPDGLEDAPQLQVDIDREKAAALGVGFDAISTALGTSLGSSYLNDFPNAGRMQRVVVQADAKDRMQPEQILQINVVNGSGQNVPLSAFASTRWIKGQMQAVRYNGYPAMRILGDAAPGFSSGQAMAEIEKISQQLPPGVGIEWTGLSREEKLSGSQATMLLAFSLLAVFLCLAALYESWSIPMAVLLVVPLGIFGALLGALMGAMPNDVYFKVGLITVMGLSAKNAILIIEFAKELQEKGMGLFEATLQACHLRFRPIIMTSLAFILGVLPLVLANGAGSAAQRAIGTGVMSGMISATVLAVLFVPVFFVVIRRFFPGKPASKDEADLESNHA